MSAEYQNNGKQSQATRLEMLITIKYLLDECPSENKASKTTALTDYALKHFNVNLDRRRANSILDDLVKFTNDYKGILPYIVKKVDKKPRYYIVKNIFSHKAIKDISASLANNYNLTANNAKNLLEVFLNTVCNQEDKEKYLAKVDKKRFSQKHIAVALKAKYVQFEELRDNNKRFYFKFDEKPGVKDIASGKRINKLLSNKAKNVYEDYLAGIVYEIFGEGDDADVCIYLPDHKDAVMVNINNIFLKEDFEPIRQWSPTDFELVDSQYGPIDEWVAKYYSGKTGYVDKIVFKFFVGPRKKQLKEYASKYEEFFKKPMEYQLQKREVKIPKEDGSFETLVVEDAITSVDSNFAAFKKWYWEKGVFESVVILEPAYYNNLLLTDITRRFIRRMRVYGIKQETEKEGN